LDSVSLRVPSKLIMNFTFLVLEKRWAPVLQLDARPRQIRFTNLWIFLALRLFLWTIYCVIKFSLLLCFVLIFLLFVLYLRPCCSDTGPISCDSAR
jgi:hypothetical protein